MSCKCKWKVKTCQIRKLSKRGGKRRRKLPRHYFYFVSTWRDYPLWRQWRAPRSENLALRHLTFWLDKKGNSAARNNSQPGKYNMEKMRNERPRFIVGNKTFLFLVPFLCFNWRREKNWTHSSNMGNGLKFKCDRENIFFSSHEKMRNEGNWRNNFECFNCERTEKEKKVRALPWAPEEY